ncbi:ABC transporter permease [Vogesella indigofera]|uniref:ABC transporter permease n=1 Tax=Vogesella indigofera TaxID=45465 RepID=UPI00234EF340|nr:ABC transporter permease [Vogesella indigofera]MDC7711548.1 ABC transporter permease [Vogesella indigofera]
MLFHGYEAQILDGTWMSIKLSLLSLALAIAFGLLGALCKLSRNPLLYRSAQCYSTLIRSVPDLVMMLLMFYSLQIGLNHVTDRLALPQIDIDPFSAGVVTIGFIYGAYFTETFRGAFLAVPRGQIEAGTAYGMSSLLVFRRILFPQMMRFALPGLGNNWQVLVKASALVSIIGLADIIKVTQDAGRSTMQLFYFSWLAAFIFLAITTVSSVLLHRLERRYNTGVKESRL